MKYEPTISLGAVIQFITLICAGIGVFVTLVRADTQHDERIAINAQEIKRVEQQAAEANRELKDEVKEVNRTLGVINQNMLRYLVPRGDSQHAFSKPNTR